MLEIAFGVFSYLSAGIAVIAVGRAIYFSFKGPPSELRYIEDCIMVGVAVLFWPLVAVAAIFMGGLWLLGRAVERLTKRLYDAVFLPAPAPKKRLGRSV